MNNPYNPDPHGSNGTLDARTIIRRKGILVRIFTRQYGHKDRIPRREILTHIIAARVHQLAE